MLGDSSCAGELSVVAYALCTVACAVCVDVCQHPSFCRDAPVKHRGSATKIVWILYGLVGFSVAGWRSAFRTRSGAERSHKEFGSRSRNTLIQTSCGSMGIGVRPLTPTL